MRRQAERGWRVPPRPPTPWSRVRICLTANVAVLVVLAAVLAAGGTAAVSATGMYSFGAYVYGGNPGAQPVRWTEDSGYPPAMRTTRPSIPAGT